MSFKPTFAEHLATAEAVRICWCHISNKAQLVSLGSDGISDEVVELDILRPTQLFLPAAERIFTPTPSSPPQELTEEVRGELTSIGGRPLSNQFENILFNTIDTEITNVRILRQTYISKLIQSNYVYCQKPLHKSIGISRVSLRDLVKCYNEGNQIETNIGLWWSREIFEAATQKGASLKWIPDLNVVKEYKLLPNLEQSKNCIAKKQLLSILLGYGWLAKQESVYIELKVHGKWETWLVSGQESAKGPALSFSPHNETNARDWSAATCEYKGKSHAIMLHPEGGMEDVIQILKTLPHPGDPSEYFDTERSRYLADLELQRLSNCTSEEGGTSGRGITFVLPMVGEEGTKLKLCGDFPYFFESLFSATLFGYIPRKIRRLCRKTKCSDDSTALVYTFLENVGNLDCQARAENSAHQELTYDPENCSIVSPGMFIPNVKDPSDVIDDREKLKMLREDCDGPWREPNLKMF